MFPLSLITFIALAGASVQAVPWRGAWRHDSSGAVVAPAISSSLPDPAPIPVPVSVPAPAPSGSGGAESHQVTLVNNCPSGSPVFIHRDSAEKSPSTTISGPLYGGVAWLDGYASCEMSGVNCGTVEFSLINPGGDKANTQNSINYSLQTQGNHLFQYPMNFHYTGGCSTGAPGKCGAADQCPGAFVGTDTASGTPVNCVGDNAGIVITFC